MSICHIASFFEKSMNFIVLSQRKANNAFEIVYRDVPIKPFFLYGSPLL